MIYLILKSICGIAIIFLTVSVDVSPVLWMPAVFGGGLLIGEVLRELRDERFC